MLNEAPLCLNVGLNKKALLGCMRGLQSRMFGYMRGLVVLKYIILYNCMFLERDKFIEKMTCPFRDDGKRTNVYIIYTKYIHYKWHVDTHIW